MENCSGPMLPWKKECLPPGIDLSYVVPPKSLLFPSPLLLQQPRLICCSQDVTSVLHGQLLGPCRGRRLTSDFNSDHTPQSASGSVGVENSYLREAIVGLWVSLVIPAAQGEA